MRSVIFWRVLAGIIVIWIDGSVIVWRRYELVVNTRNYIVLHDTDGDTIESWIVNKEWHVQGQQVLFPFMDDEKLIREYLLDGKKDEWVTVHAKGGL